MSTIRSWLVLTGLSILWLNACSEPGIEPPNDSDPGTELPSDGDPGPKPPGQEPQNKAVHDYITSISTLILPSTSHTESQRTLEEIRDATINMCTYTDVSETNHFDKLVSFDPNADVLWPGALVQGQSLTHGLLSPIGALRAPGTITLTNARIDDSSPEEYVYSRTLQSPSLASTQDAIQNILTAESINYAAKVAYTMHQAYSLNEGAIKAGIAAQFLGNTLSTTFGQTWTQSKTTFLVDFTQAYYTVSFNAPTDPAAFFAPTTTVADLSPFIDNGNPPGYLSSVTYGRRLLVKFESSEDSRKVSATLDATLAIGKAGGEITLDSEQQRVLREMKMTLLALGGPAGSAVNVVAAGQDKIAMLQSYFQDGANFSRNSPGVPLSYTVRYLSNYQPLMIASTTSYTTPNCVEKVSIINVALQELYIHANGEWLGDGEINYDVYVDENPNPAASARNVKRGDNTSISLGQRITVTKPQKDGNSLVVRAHVWEGSKHVYPAVTHTFSIAPKTWSNIGPNSNTAETSNLKVSLRYNATTN